MRKSRIESKTQERLVEYFVAGATARCASQMVGVHRNTAIYYFQRLREIIAHHQEQEALEVFDGEIEIDESYFGGERKGKRGRGSAGKVPVFGLLKRGGKVYAQIIPDASRATLLPIIKKKVAPDSIVYSDFWRAYNTLSVNNFRHFRINHSKHFVMKRNHVNGIENFWSQSKRHLRKFNGIPKHHFQLFLKECEWRFNNPNVELQLKQLKQLVRQYLT